MAAYTMYTDGSCPRNGSIDAVGGWAFVGVRNPDLPINLQETWIEASGRMEANPELPNTSIRAELLAAIKALEHTRDGSSVVLYSDSAYLVNGITQRWYVKWFATGKNSAGMVPANLDLWHELVDLIKARTVRMIHIKGHAGHRWQELCDTLAVTQSKKGGID